MRVTSLYAGFQDLPARVPFRALSTSQLQVPVKRQGLVYRVLVSYSLVYVILLQYMSLMAELGEGPPPPKPEPHRNSFSSHPPHMMNVSWSSHLRELHYI